MNKKKTMTTQKISSILIILVLLVFGLYKYGYKIPVLKQTAFFSGGHDHTLRPVLNEEGKIDYWTCTMHTSMRLKDPGKCPICSMDLVPVMKRTGNQSESGVKTEEMHDMEDMNMDSQSGQEMSGMQGHDHSMMNMPTTKRETGDSSRSMFTVSPERQQRIGVKTQKVTERALTKKIRTVGMVELDETKIEHVHTKFSGWIDKVFVDYTFQHVKKGDPLFSIYSPELVSTQEEYILALKSKNILSGNEFPEISYGANSLAEATRKRLELWDISDNQINEIERSGKAKTSLVFYSPITGHVMFKNAFENMYVEPNTRLYTIADHSTVWVNADIYENDISLVKEGEKATMTVESLPGVVFEGKVTFIWPHLMAKTRTTKARLEFPNPDLKLLPEMYANVNIEIPMKTALTIPESAVIKTGVQDIVFVDKGQGNMEIRKVELGQEAEGFYEVLRGLSEGESVVSRANFLIDAESKVQAAVAVWNDESDKKVNTVNQTQPEIKDNSMMDMQKNEKLNQMKSEM